jgi:transposase
MALGKRKREQQAAWVATTELPKSPGHPFYRKLNQLLADAEFDDWIEDLCRPHYADKHGRPSIPPGIYFRMILVGYFEGVSSQRGIAWRCSDSRSLAEFLGVPVTEATPDHSSLSRTHGRLPLEVHEQVFAFVLSIAAQKKLLSGKTVGVDSTMLEADAAMKSIVRKDTGDDWKTYVKGLAEAAGLQNPTDEELRRFDKNRADKKVSNDDWKSRTDPDARIAKMKDGRTHLAYKAEHVVDLETEFLLSAVVCHADQGDPETLMDSVMQAKLNLDAAKSEIEIREAVADKGYHKAATLELCQALNVRTYVSERAQRHKSRWTDKPPEYRQAVYANRRRVGGARSKRLQRLRSERVERSFAHVCETGGARRCWLHGIVKVCKRYLLQAAARNLGLILRKLFGMGTPRGLQTGRDLAAPSHLIINIAWCVVRAWIRVVLALDASLGLVRQRTPGIAPAT